MTDSNSRQRRQLLAQLVRLLFFIGLLAFGWVIVSSLTINHQGEEQTSHSGIEVDIAQLKPGQLKKVSLRHKEVWIFHRTTEDIAQLKKQGGSLRSQRDAFFVFFPYEPKRQCLVNWDETSRRFYDTCNARYFNLAGHLVGEKDTIELAIPEYRFVSEHLIQIDAR